MPLPGGITSTTVTIKREDTQGNPATSGTFIFTPTQSPLVDGTDAIEFDAVPITATMSGSGTMSQSLINTDQLQPAGWLWNIQETVNYTGGQVFKRTYQIALPSSYGSTVDLSAIPQAVVVPLTITFLPLSGGTMTGNINLGSGVNIVGKGGNNITLGAGGQIANLFPTGDTTGTLDTAAIQAALNLGLGTVTLARGIFYLNAPLAIPPYCAVVGAPETTQVAEHSTGTVLKVVSGFTGRSITDGGTVVLKAAIVLLGQSYGGYSTVSEEQRVENIYIDGSSAPSAVAGLLTYGRIQRHRLINLHIDQVTGVGVLELLDVAGNQPDAAYRERVFVRFNGDIGFSLRAADSTSINCLSSNTTGLGWFINTTSNSKYISCRSEHSGAEGWGYVCKNEGNSAGGVTFVNCSTDGNTNDGIKIGGTINSVTSDATGVPLFMVGCHWKRDGDNGGSGGGGFAGIHLAGYNAPVSIDGCQVYPGLHDDGSGTNCPATGLLVDTGSLGSVSGTHIHGATTAITDNAGLNYDNSVTTATGSTSSPTVNMSPNIANYQGKSATLSGPLSVGGTVLASIQAGDLGYLAQSFDISSNAGTGVALGGAGTAGAGILNLIKIPLYGQSLSTTGVRLDLTTLGSGLTSAENFIFLYNSAGTFLAATADQTTTWNTGGSTGEKDANWVSGPFNISGSFVWVALAWNGTTGPSFLRGENLTAGLANGKLSAATSRYGSILSGITTNTPGNFTPSSISQKAATIWGAIF